MADPAPRAVTFAIGGPIAVANLPGLCARICALLEASGARLAVCDATGIGVTAATVDALARLQLAARRHGCRIRLRNASPELLELLALMGLSDVLPG